MDLSHDQIAPFLSERGRLEYELAASRAVIALQNETIRRMTEQAVDTARSGDV
jgi:hypothetical protein